jgi:hypothetical protein
MWTIAFITAASRVALSAMATQTVRFLALMCTAIAMAGGIAHLLELHPKMMLSREDYRVVQQIYQGWAFLGIAVVGALVASAVLVGLERESKPAFYLSLVALACIALSLVVFFTVTFPVNRITQNWTVLPQGWEELRRRWEYSHAANAVLYFVALACLTLSIAES